MPLAVHQTDRLVLMRQVNILEVKVTLKPTDEQVRAIDLFKTGGSLAIEAGAGTGKTSTLVLLAKAAGDQNGQYVAFNKALVEESRAKFPLTVGCNTAHSLAFRAVGKNYAPRLNASARMTGSQIAARLGMQPFQAVMFDGQEKTLWPGFLASLAMKTVTQFCQSADTQINPGHVPWQKGLSQASMYDLRLYVMPFAADLWRDIQQPYGWVPFKHEHYLKIWQLRNPYIGADYILFDESQDANPVIAAIVAEQSDHAQLVYVGDSQQEIYAWTGAVNALSKVEVKHRTYLTQSFRFGQAVADRANQVLDMIEGAELRLTGNPAIDSKLERLDLPRAILVRTNATALTYLMALQEKGRAAHLVGGGTDLVAFARAAEELQNVGHSSHPDLVCFDSWAAVREYVQGDEGGEDLRLMVKLTDSFGPAAIVAAIEQMPREERADVTISTAHKSKGREWKSVQLAGDFPQTADSGPADLRLLYVAVTRAKEVLDDTALKDVGGKTSGLEPFTANEPVH